jgi:hypothetical protein
MDHFSRVVFAAALLAACTDGSTHRPTPNEGAGKATGQTGPTGTPTGGGTWQTLKTPATFDASHAHLLTNGNVIVQQLETSNWWQLTPDATGSYVAGTWKQLAAMPSSYSPLYYASAVLPDGRLIVEGGEYNGGATADTNLGAIYDPVTNAWTAVTAPTGWTSIGDASGVVLPSGTYLLSNAISEQDAVLNAKTLTWTETGTGKADINDEEGWTLLPNGLLLTVDTNNTTNAENSELYDPSTSKWTSGGSTGIALVDPSSHEIGPSSLRPDGTVFYSGATNHTAVFNPTTKKWTAGPDFPTGIDIEDGPAAVLPSGNVLVGASPGTYQPGAQFFEFDGSSLTQVPAIANAASISSYQVNFLMLPTGQVLATDFSTDIEIYTALGSPNASWLPKITTAPAKLTHGTTAQLTADRINGLSQGAYYGDDNQASTAFPIVQIKNVASGHVVFARTHDGSTFAIGATVTGTTNLDVPTTTELGASQLTLITNGIASTAVNVVVD